MKKHRDAEIVRQAWRFWIAFASIAAGYVIFAEIGFSLAFSTRQVTAVWPPAGIAVGALLLFGYRVWPAVYLGAFISNAMTNEPIGTAAAIAFGNTAGPLVAVFLLNRFARFNNRFDSLRDVLALTLAALGAMLVNATNGALALALSGIIGWNAFPSVWLLWWAGDSMGVLLVAPLLLTWAAPRRAEQPGDRQTELAILGITLIATAWLSFGSDIPLAYPVYPFVIWSALRFGQRETATAIAVICTIAIAGTANGHGPFRSGPFDARLALLMTFMAVLAVTGHVLAVVSAERRAAEKQRNEALEATRRVAHTLQAAFLPTLLPQRSDLHFDALYLPAEREALIGGDWYDAFTFDDGRIIVSIGDVSGHGIDAAVTAGRIRQAIYAGALDGAGPAEILAHANRLVHHREESIASAVVAAIDPSLSEIRFAGAGHPPPIVASRSTPARLLPYGSPPLGALSLFGFDENSLALEPGTLFVFYTDGLTEFRRDVKSAERSLLDAATQIAADAAFDRPAERLRRSVMGSSPAMDDVAIIVMRRS